MTERLGHNDVAGTERGYEWHRRNHIAACTACVDAHRRTRQAERDRAQPGTASTRVPLWLLGLLLDRVSGDTRQTAVQQLGEDTTRRASRATQNYPCDTAEESSW